MRNVRCGGLIAFALVMSCAGAASAFSVSYDQQATTKGMVIRSAVRLKDGRFRAESTMEGIKSGVIRNDSGVYQYLPDQHLAMRLPALDPAQYPLGEPEDYQEYLDQNEAQRVGSETINGYPCDIYEFNDQGDLITAWVWTEHPFPVKVVQRGAGGGGLMTVELSNIQIDAPIGEDTFQLPPDVKVMDMGSLPIGSSGSSGDDLATQMMQRLNQETE